MTPNTASLPLDVSPPDPPIAAKRPRSEPLHGVERVDDYYWLRNREDPDVVAYLTAENAYTDALTAHTKPLQDQLYREILGRIKETDEQVPAPDHGWLYYSRTEEGKAYPIYARKRTLTAAEEIILDQNEEARPYAFYQLGGMEVSPDGHLLALLVDTNGHEDFVLQVRDLRTGAWLPDRVENLSWGLAWASDSATLFYVSGDEAKRPEKVWRHIIGDAPERDVAVFHEPNVLFNVNLHRARSGQFVCIHASSFTQDEWHVIDAAAPHSAPQLIAPRAEGLEYHVEPGGAYFHIRTNRNNAVNFKVMRAPVEHPAAWEEWIAYRPDVFVEQVDAFAEWVVLSERREGLRHVVIHSLATGDAHDVAFDDAAYGVELTDNLEFATYTLRFTYSSLMTPPTVYDYDMRTHARTLRKQQEVLGGYDATRYAVERRMVLSRDGRVHIPVSMIYRKPLVRDGARPLVLYAYGSYGHTIEPTFNSARFSLVDRGYIYAVAHVRGGQELGRPWYDAGKMMQKLNTFTDFIDVAESLIADKYTRSDRLVAHGGSAGGLLMGAIANMRPDLFRAIVADVPFVDVINTMLDASIPLTAQEWEQWGNPVVREHFEYMARYSPYDNVIRRAYPWMLVMSGINDSRVAYWEPAKWVAKLRAHKTDTNPLLMHMLMTAGHGGSSGRYDRLRETAFRYAFMLDAVGFTAAAV